MTSPLRVLIAYVLRSTFDTRVYVFFIPCSYFTQLRCYGSLDGTRHIFHRFLSLVSSFLCLLSFITFASLRNGARRAVCDFNLAGFATRGRFHNFSTCLSVLAGQI
jgi:hypothetical protein